MIATMPEVMTEIVLASGSPRRRELLGKLGVKFRVRAADIRVEREVQISPRRASRIAREQHQQEDADKQGERVGARAYRLVIRHIRGLD